MTKLLKNTLFENVKHLNENFSKHYHDTYTIGITYNGVIKTYNSNRSLDFYKYSIRVNNPNEVHSGVSQDWSHSNFYPTIELLSDLYEQIFFEKKVPYFENYIINDKFLFLKFHNFFDSFFKKENDMIIESNLIDALSYLIINFTSYTKVYDKMFENKIVLKKSLELINDCIDENISLDKLADNCNLSKYHFLRVFKKEMGLTPHSFIINERLNRANHLIQKGKTISEACMLVGFNDQSHFTRNFKKYFGYTPSLFQKNSNIIL
ncbi:transcriptional regulator, AraC family [Arcobacter venerupis]|uniref:Transcriptional regulator, AraC family n=1 Tax=Arcobacter venerupis TaxID=1054033 RepID=A0AAE7B9C8_9BACT|nr:AraC family transcriptional regulator [Arcobacter venerupis]QKF67873.1 transcriptional regulator, AraC family [Arcobacter venerupis]RWS49477.1 AraC family transcriptional regulator [Arcobacter venerupis]